MTLRNQPLCNDLCSKNYCFRHSYNKWPLLLVCVCGCMFAVCVSQVLSFPAPNTLIIAYQQFGPEVFLCRQLIWFISKLPVQFDQRTRREGKQEKLGEWQKWRNRENESKVGGCRKRKRKMLDCRKWKREYNRVLWGKMEGWHWRFALITQKEKRWLICLPGRWHAPAKAESC